MSGAAAKLWPSEPEPPSGPRREGLWLALLAVLAALLVVAGLVAWVRYGRDASDTQLAESAETGADPAAEDEASVDDEAAAGNGDEDVDPRNDEASDEETGSAAEGEAASEGTVEHAPCPADVDEVICDAARFVETARGGPFKEFPDVQLVDEQAFTDRLLADFDDAAEALEASNQTWRSLGFIEPDVDLLDALTASYSVSVIGVYFPDTKELYVKGGELSLFAQTTVVHELVHAWDDQWFDLLREEYDDAEDEISYGFSAVAEGNASRVEDAWKAELSAAERQRLATQEASLFGPEELEIFATIPRLLLQFQISPYIDGSRFVEALLAEGGEAAVNAALESPPRTSEQVLHPGLYPDEQALPVARPPLDPGIGEADVAEEGMVGELGFDLWFGDDVGDGWGGDRYVTWTTSDGACTRIDAVGDTTRDTQELESAARSWMSLAPGRRSIDVVAVDGRDVVRMTGCYSGS